MDLFLDPGTAALIPVVTALVQGIKTELKITNGRYKFSLSILTGLILALGWALVRDNNFVSSAFDGLLIGLGASGFYDGIKILVEDDSDSSSPVE